MGMSEEELQRLEREDEEEERESLRFQNFEGKILEYLGGIFNAIDLTGLYVRAGARALLWIAIVLTVLVAKFLFF